MCLKHLLRFGTRNERGDTIVEVLIASDVVRLVLVTEYGLSNKNMLSMQDTQEHTVALKLAEEQTEQLSADPTKPAGGGCYSGAVYKSVGDAACSQTVGGATYVLNVLPAGATNEYRVSAAWTTISGKAATVMIVYRVGA